MKIRAKWLAVLCGAGLAFAALPDGQADGRSAPIVAPDSREDRPPPQSPVLNGRDKPPRLERGSVSAPLLVTAFVLLLLSVLLRQARPVPR